MRLTRWNVVGAAITALGLASAAQAGLSPIGEFTGLRSESFEGMSYSWGSGSLPVFSGLASVRERSGSSIIITNRWSFQSVVNPKDGARFMGSPSGWVTYSFNTPIMNFGGFFTTNSSVADGRVEFFLNGALLSTQPLTAPNTGQWAWNGWSSDTGFDSVRVISNYSSGGFIMQDSMQATPVPGPSVIAACALPLLAGLRRRRR